MPLRTFYLVLLTLVSLSGFATAGDYLIAWKSSLPEGTTNRCHIKIAGNPNAGASTSLKNWEGISFPLYAFIPSDFNKKISYSPASGCSHLVIDIYCHSKPDGSEWNQRILIRPCQDRTIRISEDDAFLE